MEDIIEDKSKKEEPSSRIFEIVSDEIHPETGRVLLTEEQIKHALEHKTIGRWAYIFHDKDIYNKDDAPSSELVGTTKRGHWHIVINLKTNKLPVSSIARWFGVPANFVRVKKGKNAFLDSVEYLTHEDPKQQALGKHLYSDSEVHANFDFREALSKREANRLKYGRDISDEEELLYKVLKEGMTVQQVIEADPLYYEKHYREVEGCRGQYLLRVAKMPTERTNFYICGSSDAGKSFVSEALARLLIDYNHEMSDDEIFFHVGSKNATFEKYDGQPCIIWDDCRSDTLINILGSKEAIYRVFDTHPKNVRQNVKYSSTKLINTFNIVNSVQPWNEFLRGCRIYGEDPIQINRRFPFFLIIHADDYDLGINEGFLEDYGSFNEYRIIKRLRGNFKAIAEKYALDTERVNAITGEALEPVRQKYFEVKDHLKIDDVSEEEFLKDLAEVGKTSEEPITVKVDDV